MPTSWPQLALDPLRLSLADRAKPTGKVQLQQQHSLRDREAAEARGRVQEKGLTTLPYLTMGPTKSQLGARDGGHLHNPTPRGVFPEETCPQFQILLDL